MELLILLAARNGHLVTRTEIAERLWSREVFVDTEHGINTAIAKIRQALREDPEQPRFLQTVTGKGYRFVIEKNSTAKAPKSSEELQPTPYVRSAPVEVTRAASLGVEAVPSPASPTQVRPPASIPRRR